jgi:hypothetical protein
MNNYKKIAIIFFLWLFIITIFSITVTEAQTTFKAQVPIGGFGKEETTLEAETGTKFIAQYIQAVYRYGISVGAILATVVLMAAGVVWLTSGGNQGQIGKAKEMITGSLVGLFLLFGSYMILNTINPNLVNFKTQKIEGIDKMELGCCEYTEYTTPPSMSLANGGSWTGGQGYKTAKYLDSIGCAELPYGGGKFYPDAAPSPERITSKCEKVGCCSLIIQQIGAKGPVMGSLKLQFPSTSKNCPTKKFGYAGFNAVFMNFTDSKCLVENAKDCISLPDGTQCFARSDNTWISHVYRSQCLFDGACGYCYNGSCLPLLGKSGEICGIEGNIGTCVTGNSCPDNRKEIDKGRNCEGTCCDFSIEVNI